MAKKFHHETTSDVDVEAVFEVLSGDDWAAQLATHLRDDSQTVRRDVGSDGSVTLVLSRRLPPGIPPFLQKFLPSDPRVVTTDVWGPVQDGVRHCSWTAEITGTPAKIHGMQLIEPFHAGNRHTISGEVKVSVPLIGGKAEGFIAEQVHRLVVAEVAVVEKVLTAS